MEEEWRQKGATLSDKTARKQFGLTQAEIEGPSTPVSFSTESVLFTEIHG